MMDCITREIYNTSHKNQNNKKKKKKKKIILNGEKDVKKKKKKKGFSNCTSVRYNEASVQN
jgi:hypothetical protein